ncbi:14 kDa phosphohistidine phosphatase-like [Ptychodera flava]|uniref:14 kDa phosphohistidine phosphatase-like n=1 Tax=Ptychodera flava TaxID=63121 RepID=UPI00396A70AE
MTKELSKVPDVEIDPEGIFPYILVDVTAKSGHSKCIVRGDCFSEYHSDVYDKTIPKIKAQGFDCRVMGGGKIDHRGSKKEILVYGYSGNYGEAEHTITCAVLRKKYKDYDKITHRKQNFY